MCLAGWIVLVAVIAATVVCVIAFFRGEAADDRPPGPVSQDARERTVSEGDDASLEPPDLSVFLGTAFAERQADSDTEVAEQPRHLFAGDGIAARSLDPLDDVEGLLDFGVDVERLGAMGCPCIEFEKRFLLMGKFCAKVPQARAQHGTDIFVLLLEDPPRSLFRLLSERLDIRLKL
jgi:hypothetical protein